MRECDAGFHSGGRLVIPIGLIKVLLNLNPKPRQDGVLVFASIARSMPPKLRPAGEMRTLR
jgi:hypothetical protein